MVRVERLDLYDFKVHLDYEVFEVIKDVADEEQISIEVSLRKIIDDAIRKYINGTY